MAKLMPQEARLVAAMIGGQWMGVSEIESRGRMKANSFHARKHYLENLGYRFDKKKVSAGSGTTIYVYRMVGTPKGLLEPNPGDQPIRKPKPYVKRSCGKCGRDSFFWRFDRFAGEHICDCGTIVREALRGKVLTGNFGSMDSGVDSGEHSRFGDDLRSDNHFGVKLPWDRGVVNE